ncbi:hypothetical protein B0H13DRAFT_2110859, partial [Mycena leptocephala]
MSMTACWPAFPSTTAPCANAASAFTPAPSLALVAHAHTAHPRVWVPAPRRPTAPSPPHRARSSPPSRFSPSSSYTPSLRTPDLCTGGVCAMPRPSRRPRAARVILRRAGAVADAALGLLVRLRLRSVRPPTPREDGGSYEDAPARIRRALAAVGTCKRSVGATSLSSRLATHVHVGFPMRMSCRAVCRTRPGFDVRAALLATPNAGVWVRSILHCPRWRCIHGREWPALRAAGRAG